MYTLLKGKAIPVQTSSELECYRRLKLPDSKKLIHEGGNVGPTHRPPLPPQEIFLVLDDVTV